MSLFLIVCALRFGGVALFPLALLIPLLIGFCILDYRRTCHLTYWESRAAAYRRKRLIGGSWAAFSLGLAFWMAALGSGAHHFEMQQKFMILFAIVCDALWLYGLWKSRPLRIAKYSRGLFWIAGCGEAFLKSIEAEQILMATTSNTVQRKEPRTQ